MSIEPVRPLIQATPIRMVVCDLAGTLIDYGSRAPAGVFVEIFHREGIDISMEQARGPMGMAKRDHILAISTLPEVAGQWKDRHGREIAEEDIDRMYEAFVPLQAEAIRRHSDIIPGAVEAIELCRDMNIKIGSSTGYNRELTDICIEEAGRRGLTLDTVVCADDVHAGRPAPWMLFENMRRLEVYPPAAVVKVDDTVPGLQAARNAGCWAIGVTKTGNGLGLSEEEADALPAEELAQRLEEAAERFYLGGAHMVVESIAELATVLESVESQVATATS